MVSVYNFILAIELIKDLVSYDEIQYPLLSSMVKLLVPEKDVKIDRTVIFQGNLLFLIYSISPFLVNYSHLIFTFRYL